MTKEEINRLRMLGTIRGAMSDNRRLIASTAPAIQIPQLEWAEGITPRDQGVIVDLKGKPSKTKNKNYFSPISGAGDRFVTSWRNNTNPLRALGKTFGTSAAIAAVPEMFADPLWALEGMALGEMGSKSLGFIGKQLNKRNPVSSVDKEKVLGTVGGILGFGLAPKNNITPIKFNARNPRLGVKNPRLGQNSVEYLPISKKALPVLSNNKTSIVESSTLPYYSRTLPQQGNSLNLAPVSYYSTPLSQYRRLSITKPNINSIPYEDFLKIPVVNSKGEINTEALPRLYKHVLKEAQNYVKRGENLVPLNEVMSSSRGYTTIKNHTRDVIKSAQQIPVPANSTRQDLVRAALIHDIGKIVTGKESAESNNRMDIKHPTLSAYIMSKFPEFKSDVLDAVYHHMDDARKYDISIYGKHGLEKIESDDFTPEETIGRGNSYNRNYDLIHALQAADVARGLSYDDAAMRFPQLFTYNKAHPFSITTPNISRRDQIKLLNRGFARRYGYSPIPLDADVETQNQAINDLITRDRSLVRGARDPKYSDRYDRSLEDKRNADNAAKLSIERFGENTPEGRLLVSAENVPLDPTGSGRRNLFYVSEYTDTPFGEIKLPSHHRENGALDTFLKIHPKYQDALYASASKDVLKEYAKASNDRPSGGYRVTFPFEGIKENENIFDFLERTNWQLYSGHKIKSSFRPMSDTQLLDYPYFLQTGRSLNGDIRKDFINNNKKIVDKKPINYRTVEGNKYLKELLEKHGVKQSALLTNKRDIFYDPIQGKLNDIVRSIINAQGFETFDGNVNNGSNYSYDDFQQISSDITTLYILGVITKKQRNLYVHTIGTPNFKKYYNASSIIKKLARKYDEILTQLYLGKLIKLSDEYKHAITSKGKLEFMRRKGIKPLYELPSFGNTEFFSTAGTFANPKRKSYKPDNDGPQGIIVGDKGKQVFQVTGKYNEDYILNDEKKKKGRDTGDRNYFEDTKYPITRRNYKNGGRRSLIFNGK